MTTLVIDAGAEHVRTAVYRDQILDDLQVEAAGSPSLVGRIYKGRVVKVETALDAAFVEIGRGRTGYLGIRDLLPPDKREGAFIRDHIKGGQELLVQVIKDPREEKAVQLTTRITLAGKLLVLTPDEPAVSLSHKITGSNRRNALGNWIQSILPEGIGAVVRTEAAQAEQGEIKAELDRLLALWNRIAPYRLQGIAPMLVYKEASSSLRLVRRLKNLEIHRICSNSPPQTAEILEYLNSQNLPKPEIVERVERELLDKDIADVLDPCVPLPAGGSLWIEPTRALTVIDVNSGGMKGLGDAQSTFFRVNLAAAVEIARQLRIRNITGMILIDFIDMKHSDHRKAVVACLSEAVDRDRMPVSILGYTQLGILELTRKGEQAALRDIITRPCDRCEGTGRVQQADYLDRKSPL